jgi:hydroxyacylglutathione hydrolase
MEKVNNIICIPGMELDSNVYVVGDTIFDTGTGTHKEYLFSQLKEAGIKPEDIKLIVNTHCHFDHVGGNVFFPNAKVAIHEEDAKSLKENSELTVKSLFGKEIKRHDVDIELKNGDIIGNFEVIHTPGHSKGGICLWDGENLICGDTVFANGGFGRCDIGGNIEDMRNSLRMLKKLDVKYLFPGHGPWVSNGKQHIALSNQGI